MWWWYQFCLCQIRTSKVSFLNGWRQNITFSIKWWHWLGYMEEQSSFRKPHGRSLGAPDKIRACDTISITKKHGTSLKNKSLITIPTEVESIVNSGPLTVETLSDIGSEALLSPINLLTMISDVVFTTSWRLQENRFLQLSILEKNLAITGEFWYWWQKEFLPAHQSRAKWQKIMINFKIGDIILLKNNSIENHLPTANVIDVYKSNDGYMQIVKLCVGDNKFNENGLKYLVHLIHKIQLLFDSQTEKQRIYITNMINHLEGSHELMVESCKLWTLKP